MSLIIIGKFAVASLGTGVIGVGGFFLHRFLSPTVEIYGFVEDVASADATTTDSTPHNTSTILECKIKDKENKFACEVDVIDKLTAESNSHVEWNKLSDWKPANSALEAKKFYKIKTSSSEFDKTKPLIIEVFKKEESQVKLGTITTIFISKNKSITSGKTNLFVGQASKKLDSTTGYKCSWSTTTNTEALKTCSIFPFVANDAADGQSENSTISSLKFKQTNSWDSTIKQHHYYLIQFTDQSDQKDLERFDVEGAEIIYLKDGSDEKVKFQKLSAVKLTGEQLLILKKQTAA